MLKVLPLIALVGTIGAGVSSVVLIWLGLRRPPRVDGHADGSLQEPPAVALGSSLDTDPTQRLVRRVENLKGQVKWLVNERVAALKTVESLREEVVGLQAERAMFHCAEAENQDLKAENQDLKEAIRRMSSQLADAKRRIAELEERDGSIRLAHGVTTHTGGVRSAPPSMRPRKTTKRLPNR